MLDLERGLQGALWTLTESIGAEMQPGCRRTAPASRIEYALWHYWPQHFALIAGEHQDLGLVESCRP